MWYEGLGFIRILTYLTVQFQGPIYTHGDSPAPLPPQGMIVQPEMHLPHPGKLAFLLYAYGVQGSVLGTLQTLPFRTILLSSDADHPDCLCSKLSFKSILRTAIKLLCSVVQVKPSHDKGRYPPLQFLFVFLCLGLHPHQSPAPLPNPGLYPPPVSMSPGQPPPQQLLAPTYFSAPGVMNFGNPSYPYAPGALPPPPPPHLYPNTQVRHLIFLGIYPLNYYTRLW